MMPLKRWLLPSAAVLMAALPVAARGGDPVKGGGDPVAPAPVTPWGAEYFPNVPLTTHEGREVHFFDDLIQDRVVVINFIYTSCPDACPLETAKLKEVYDLLRDRAGKDIFFLSVSIDPTRDTPEVLKAYAERFGVGPGWLFLTGKIADIVTLRQKLGMIDPDGEEDLSDHTLSLLIGNQSTGQWMKRSPFDNPHFLAQQIGSQLFNWKDAPKDFHDYSEAPKLRSLTRGESLFRTRCLACHIIGAEDGIVRQGPNLVGVADRRDAQWLRRWLAEPDAMLAEKDPIAMELFAAYRNVPMPNMRLNETEVDAILEYMQSESDYFLASQEDWEDPVPEPAGFDFDVIPEPGASDAAPAPKAPCCEKRDELVIGAEETVPAAIPPAPAPASAERIDFEAHGPELAGEPPACCQKEKALVLGAPATVEPGELEAPLELESPAPVEAAGAAAPATSSGIAPSLLLGTALTLVLGALGLALGRDVA